MLKHGNLPSFVICSIYRNMGNIKSIDMLFLDELFDMGGGYVLNFSDRTMAEFFGNELAIDIYDPAFAKNGTSKARRLRCFLQNADKATVVRALRALWEYRQALRAGSAEPDSVHDARTRLNVILAKLRDTAKEQSSQPPPVGAPNAAQLTQLSADLIALSQLDPHPRGFAFEKFLKALFDVYGLEGRDPFRLRGEQIDGSFVHAHETYLLEAKWQSPRIGAEDLHAFHGKLEGKAAWARGLFISQSGFTEDGLHAFGRGKRVICMDGFDLYETLSRSLSLSDVIARKVRNAAETGLPFARVRDLFLV